MSSFHSKLILWLSEYKGCRILFFVLFSSHRTKLVSCLSLFLLVILCLGICFNNVLETRINCVNGFCVKSIERSRYRYSFSLSECQPSQAHFDFVRLFVWERGIRFVFKSSYVVSSEYHYILRYRFQGIDLQYHVLSRQVVSFNKLSVSYHVQSRVWGSY